MARFLINTETLFAVHRVDRETECYWVEVREGHSGDWESRSKKQYGDVVFPTFAAAKAELVRRLALRLARAEAMTGPGQYVTHGGG